MLRIIIAERAESTSVNEISMATDDVMREKLSAKVFVVKSIRANAPKSYEFLINCAVEAITGIAEAGNNVTLFV